MIWWWSAVNIPDLKCRDDPEDWELHSTAHCVCCCGGSSWHHSLSHPAACSQSPAQSLIKKYQISLGIPSPDCSLTWTLSWTDVQLGVGVDAVHARVVSPRVLVLVLVLVWVWAANTGVITVLDGPIFLFWYFACNIQIRLCGSLQLWVYLSKIVNDNYHIIMLSTSVKNPNLSEIKSFITTSCCCRPTYIPTAPPAS